MRTSKEEKGTTGVTKQEFEQFASKDGKTFSDFAGMTTGGTRTGDDLYQGYNVKTVGADRKN